MAQQNTHTRQLTHSDTYRAMADVERKNMYVCMYVHARTRPYITYLPTYVLTVPSSPNFFFFFTLL